MLDLLLGHSLYWILAGLAFFQVWLILMEQAENKRERRKAERNWNQD
jgi:uncharacterized protein (DUF2062 family)